MRGYTRHRGSPGSWWYELDLGLADVQVCRRCSTPKRAARWWVDRRPKKACPDCGGPLELLTDQRRRLSKGGFATEKAAQTALNDLVPKVQHGGFVAPTRITLREFAIDKWLPAMKSTVRPSTALSYEGHVRAHIVPELGALKMEKVTAPRIQALYSKLLEEPRAEEKEPLSPTTVRHIAMTLHRLFADAVKWGMLQRNPADSADPPKTARAEMKVWSIDQLRTFLEARAEDRLHGVWYLAAHTGMRRGEVLGLKWSDVDLEGGKLSVQRSLVGVGYEVKVSEPKSGRGRVIALSASDVEILKAEAAKQLDEQSAAKEAWQDTGYVFTRVDGRAWHPDRVSKLFGEAVAAAKVAEIRFHDLRHSHASHLLSAAVHPKIVAERLGHSSIAITLDTYSHLIPAMQEDAVARLEALMVASAAKAAGGNDGGNGEAP